MPIELKHSSLFRCFEERDSDPLIIRGHEIFAVRHIGGSRYDRHGLNVLVHGMTNEELCLFAVTRERAFATVFVFDLVHRAVAVVYLEVLYLEH